MTHETRTADDIERDIADERSQMSNTINDLQKKFSVDAIADDLGHMVRDLGDDFGRTVSRTVGRNPAAMVVVGAGLAWLILGASRNTSVNQTDARSRRNSGSPRQFETWGNDPLRAERATEEALNEDGAWFGAGRRKRNSGDSASQRSYGTPNGATSMMERAKDAVSDASSSVGHAASDLSDRLSHGLEDLSEAAKTRVISARRAAHDARDASEAAMHRGATAASDIFREQPLVVGALAVAIGAALGSLLPHSKIEDDTMGESSDRLFREAQEVFREERDKAMAVVKGAASDVKDEIRDIRSDLKSEAADVLPEDKTIGDVVVNRAADATSRVYKNAKNAFEEKGSDRTKT